MSIDGRPDDFPASWHPATNRDILVALISEVRNALIPAQRHIEYVRHIDAVDRMAVERVERVRLAIDRVMTFTAICQDKMTHL